MKRKKNESEEEFKERRRRRLKYLYTVLRPRLRKIWFPVGFILNWTAFILWEIALKHTTVFWSRLYMAVTRTKVKGAPAFKGIARKGILVLGPHTEAVKEVLRGLAIKEILGLPKPIYTLIKMEAFIIPPAEDFLRWIGALPVDRYHVLEKEEREGTIDNLAVLLEEAEEGMAVFTPQGKRNKEDWEPGFMNLGQKTGIPLFFAVNVHSTKTVVIVPEPFYVTEDMQHNQEHVRAIYDQVANYSVKFK